MISHVPDNRRVHWVRCYIVGIREASDDQFRETTAYGQAVSEWQLWPMRIDFRRQGKAIIAHRVEGIDHPPFALLVHPSPFDHVVAMSNSSGMKIRVVEDDECRIEDHSIGTQAVEKGHLCVEIVAIEENQLDGAHREVPSLHFGSAFLNDYVIFPKFRYRLAIDRIDYRIRRPSGGAEKIPGGISIARSHLDDSFNATAPYEAEKKQGFVILNGPYDILLRGLREMSQIVVHLSIAVFSAAWPEK